MKVTRAQAEANRERVIEQASKLFRERGFAGVGLNELMQAAGLTRGGFYGQFESKQELIKLALGHAQESRRQRWETVVAEAGDRPLRAFVSRYLSDTHRDRPGAGCALAALGGDVGREDAAIQAVFDDGVRGLTELIGRMMPGETDVLRQQQAWACLAALLGALVLSRAVADEALSHGIREATASTLLSALEQAGSRRGPDPISPGTR